MGERRRGSAIEWLLGPWITEAGLLARAIRISAVAAVLIATIVPSMMLYYGLDDWWWDGTLAVCSMAVVGIVVLDALADATAKLLRRPIRGPARVAFLVVGLALGVLAGYAILSAFTLAPDRTMGMVWRDYRRTMGILIPVVVLVVVTGTSLWYRAEAFRLQEAAATAGFQALRGQMQPHFLFNALNALKELTMDEPQRAAAFAQRVADLYRLILEVSTAPTTTLSHELEIVASYLEVERVRYGDRLRVHIDVPHELRTLHVPSLMLQTLAENAVKHGIAKDRRGGEVRIRARNTSAGALELEVSNTGAPYAPPTATDRARTGLANTRARLALMYGRDHDLSITSDPQLGTRVRFSVSGREIG